MMMVQMGLPWVILETEDQVDLVVQMAQDLEG